MNLSQTVPATQVTGTTALAAGQNIYGIGLPFNTTVKANQTISGSTSTWEIDNPVASVTGTITGTTLTISQVTSGTLVAGQVVGGSGVTAGTSITGQLTSDEADAAPGKTGTYSVSVSHPTTATVTSAATTVAAGTVITSAGFAIDDTVPVVTSITTSTDNSPKAVGATVSIQVGFSEAVTVTGSPTISLGTGAPVTTNVAYVSGSLSNTLNFTYTVAAGNGTARLDHAGAAFRATISGSTMTVSSITSPGLLAVGQTILGVGVTPGTTITALVTGAGGTGTYTVSTSQNVSDETAMAALTLNGTIRDTRAQNQLILANVVAAIPPATSGLYTKNIAVDTSPRAVSILSAPNVTYNNPVGVGSVVDVQVNLPDAVTVTGQVAQFSGSISGTTLTVDSVTSGTIAAGQTLAGAAADFTGSITGNILTVSAVSSGTLAAGQTIYGQGVP
ncbi:MAG: hypothetical protein EBQ56_00980, partial [Proteobacteria bacterium]|nr:hypothetical protein [Pseudomonadota bacterium]